MRPLLTFVLLVFLLLGPLGCSRGPQKPEGLPDLHPVTLTVIQDGKPLDGAIVSLRPLDSSNHWGSNGLTDANGKAIIKTHGDFAGAPVGKYKVAVIKTEVETSGKTSVSYNIINPVYTTYDTTTLEIEVGTGSNETSLDLGEAVRIKSGETVSKSE